jgi:SAM-dependent methyltransferase
MFGVSEPQFRKDLYEGTAAFYDRHRPPYPEALLEDLRQRVPVTGQGRLLDLACGTGQLAIPLSSDFDEVWAVDQEPEAVAFGRNKAEQLGIANIKWLAGAAEDVALDGDFDLAVIGNAFHRLRREVVARRLLSLLAPGGAVALVWGDTPGRGERPWQRELALAFRTWTARLGATDRVPERWEQAMASDPHNTVLERAGFVYEGKFEFIVEQRWTVESLIGFAYSTSLLNLSVVGDRRDEFEHDLRTRLTSCDPDGVFVETASYAYELARLPA